MASKLPPVKNAAYTFRCVLFAQDTNQIKSNPTIATGDWKCSVDGAAFANLTTLPDVDPDSTVQVKVSLSADEMNGDEIMITAIDAAGDEWHSAAWVIHTAAQTFDTMDTNIDSVLADTGTDGVVVAPRTVEGALDEIEALRLVLAALVGKATGGGTATVTFRDTGDSKDRIVLTVDSSGNRSAVTLDAS